MSTGTISDWVIRNHRHYVVVNKPAGLAVQSADDEQMSLEQVLSAYTKCSLYPVHRIDQPVSGLVIFGKNGTVAGQIATALASDDTIKRYLAIVAKVPDLPPSRELEHYLRKRGSKTTISTSDDNLAKKAVLNYNLETDLDRYHVLEVMLSTGRYHQIRAQLAAEGLYIQGDVKYGARRGNKDRSIGLHAYQLSYKDPVSGDPITFEAPLPTTGLWSHVTV